MKAIMYGAGNIGRGFIGQKFYLSGYDTTFIDVDMTDAGYMTGHEGNLRHFLDVVLNGAKPDFVPQQGVNMIKILSAIYESAKTGKEVSLVD